MKKLLIVNINQTGISGEKTVISVQTKITCPRDSELDTKLAIEATRNPNVLIEIISHDKTKEELADLQPAFTEIRDILAKSDSIIAGFLPLEPCEGNCEACMIHAKNIERRSVLEIMLMAMLSH